MKTLTIAALSTFAVLGLSACDSDTVEEGDMTVVEGEDAYSAPVEDPAMDMGADAADGDSMSISEDGVDATINDGNTSVNADLDGDPSVDVQVD